MRSSTASIRSQRSNAGSLMSNQDTLSLLVQEAAKLLSPLRVAISSPESFKTFMARLGWTIDDIPQPIQDLATDLETLIAKLKVVTDGNVGFEAINDLREAIIGLVESIKAISSAPDSAFPAHLVADNFKNEFPAQLITFLIVDYLSTDHPTAGFALRTLGVMQRRYATPAGNRRPFIRSTFEFSNIAKVLDDPSIVFTNAFGWGTDTPDYNALFEQLD